MKKLFAILLLAALLVSLAACGSSGPKDPNCGLYEAVEAEALGITIKVEEVFEDGLSIELKDGGKAVFRYEGKDYSMKWTHDGAVFHAEGGGAELDGTVADGVMLLEDILGSGVQIKLVCAELGGA